jgi:hypothetical protein
MRKMLLVGRITSVIAADLLRIGKWSSSQNGRGRAIRIKVESEADVVFTSNDSEIRTKIASQKVEESSFISDDGFDLSSYRLRSSLSDVISSDSAQGTYRTKLLVGGEPVDPGTFSASVSR